MLGRNKMSFSNYVRSGWYVKFIEELWSIYHIWWGQSSNVFTAWIPWLWCYNCSCKVRPLQHQGWLHSKPKLSWKLQPDPQKHGIQQQRAVQEDEWECFHFIILLVDTQYVVILWFACVIIVHKKCHNFPSLRQQSTMYHSCERDLSEAHWGAKLFKMSTSLETGKPPSDLLPEIYRIFRDRECLTFEVWNEIPWWFWFVHYMQSLLKPDWLFPILLVEPFFFICKGGVLQHWVRLRQDVHQWQTLQLLSLSFLLSPLPSNSGKWRYIGIPY